MKKHLITDQKGAILVLVLMSLIFLTAIVGLVVDLGRLFIVKDEMINAAESSALTAALALRNGCEADTAKEMATNIRMSGHAGNTVDNNPDFIIDIPDIRIGRYSTIARVFNENVTPSNAAEVIARKDSSLNNPFTALIMKEPSPDDHVYQTSDIDVIARAKFDPADIMIVQDISGSMTAADVPVDNDGDGIPDVLPVDTDGDGIVDNQMQRIQAAINALNILVNLLDPVTAGCDGNDNDYEVGLVTFPDRNLNVGLNPIIDNAPLLRAAFPGFCDWNTPSGWCTANSWCCNGGTPTDLGLNNAVTALNASPRTAYPQKIFLFSDGTPNDPDEATKSADAAAASGIDIYSIYTGPLEQFEEDIASQPPPNNNPVTSCATNPDTDLCANAGLSRPLGPGEQPRIDRAFVATDMNTLNNVIRELISPKLTSW